jgi:DNA repair exonuclease SbcCD ATPase subunit
MTIQLKTLTLKNFLSVGQIVQTVNLDNHDLSLILGENLDLGGDGARNGVGKTSILQGISYALFGVPINNIKRDNLINRTNEKNMVVSVDFTVRGVDYRIVRGRKPNILKFFVNSQEQAAEQSDSQGENRETQAEIERVLCMNSDIFQHIVGLNSYTTPFLALKAAEQRSIIEQLLGITLLSEKADRIKELNKTTKDEIQREEYRVRGVVEANRRIQDQIDSLKKRQRLWTAKHNEDLSKLVAEYDTLSRIDIEAELLAHRELAQHAATQTQYERYTSLVGRQTSWRERLDREIADLDTKLSKLSGVDITAEMAAHSDLVRYNESVRLSGERDVALKRLKSDIAREQKTWTKLDTEVGTLQSHKCYACGQDFHDDKHEEVLGAKIAARDESRKLLDTLHSEYAQLEANTVFVGTKPVTHYATEAEAIRHGAEIDRLRDAISAKRGESDPYADQIAESRCEGPGAPPKTIYDSESDAIKHVGRVSTLLDQIERKSAETDPYGDQIIEMESSAIETVSYDEINRLTKLLEHGDYLLDLLTNKKSFVRKRIIEQNLSFLNGRLTHYLERIGLPHQVVFQNDLTVEITELGRDLDYGNLSRGESNRVILALSFAFRDVWENLYSSVNMMFVDELVDSGMDTIGVENSLSLLKEMSRRRGRSIFLVSHRDELTTRVSSVLRVVKENGFTSFNQDT